MSRRQGGCLTNEETEAQKGRVLLEVTSGAGTLPQSVFPPTTVLSHHSSRKEWGSLDGRAGVYLSRKVVFCRKLRNWHRLICQCLPRPLWSPDRIKCLDLHGGKSDPEPKQQPQGDPPSPCATDRPVTSTHDTMHSLTKHNATQTTAGKK